MRDLRAEIDDKTQMVEVSWNPDTMSTQDNYTVQYHEVESTTGGDSNTLTTNRTRVRNEKGTFFLF